MKVLIISSYATCDAVPLLSQCKAGFGYMVYDIAHSLTSKINVDFLLSNYRYSKFEHGGICFITSSMALFLKNIFRNSSLSILIKLWWRYKMQYRTIVRLVYYWLISGYYYDAIKKGKYDIVHIHGCGFEDELWMDACRRSHCPFLITLHGLNSFSESVNLEPAGKKYERDFLRRVVDGVFPISVISSGIKKKILNEYGVKSCDTIHVVCNSFSFQKSVSEDIDVRKQYGLKADAWIVLYVGNVSRNKNQEQVIRAFELMNESFIRNTYILFCGRNIEEGYSLDELIEKSKYKNHYILCGNVDKELMPHYYEQCDGVVLLSYSEGFGLSLIEGMHFGKPCLTFKDLDAFEDVFDENAVIGVDHRNDEDVAEGLQQLLTRKWNREEIVEYSKRFESDNMADSYIALYKRLIA